MTTPPRKVEHHYVDHSNDVAITTAKDATGMINNNNPNAVAFVHSTDRTFPVTLHFMLTELKSDGLDHIMTWQPHGRCFVVYKQAEFVENILPMWFRQSKFASFQRQLNLYGFKRLTSGRDKGAYYHELFLRGKPLLVHKIPRTKLKNDGARKSTSPETEPNFYALPFLPEDVVHPTKRSSAAEEPAANVAMNSIPSSSAHAAVPDSIASLRNGTGAASSRSSAVDCTLSLARLVQQSNVLRLHSEMEQLHNLDMYTRGLPTLASSSSVPRSVLSDPDLLTRLLYREAMNNIKNNQSSRQEPYASIIEPTLTPLQQLFGQHQVTLPPVPNSVVSSSQSILEGARVALLQRQLQLQQLQNQQRISSTSNIVDNIMPSSTDNLLALRLAMANGYTSMDQLLRDITVGRNMTNDVSSTRNNSGTTSNGN